MTIEDPPSLLAHSPHERLELGEAESIYGANTLKKIRGLFHGTYGLMLDQDGVVLPYNRDRNSIVDPTEDTVAAIRQLYEQGYQLMYWTDSPNNNSDVTNMLIRNKIYNLFAIVICRENYSLKTPEQIRDCTEAVSSAHWLSSATKDIYRELVLKGEVAAGRGRIMVPKMPHCLTGNCTIVDDNPWWATTRGYVDSLLDSNSYPLLPPGTLQVDSLKYDPARTYFGTEWIQMVRKEFNGLRLNV